MIHFLAGLPRSGSTVLCNLLAQHPGLTVTPTSPLVTIVEGVRDGWRGAHRAVPSMSGDERQSAAMRGLMEGYHPGRVTLDKNRKWLANLETAEAALGRPVRVVTTVRALEDVLASFEMIWRKNLAMGRVPAQLRADSQMLSLEGRVRRWLAPGDVVGGPLAALTDVWRRGLADRLLLVHYEDLTARPLEEAGRVCDFLGLERYQFRPDRVEQSTEEDDEVHGYSMLHQIRPQIAEQPSRAVEILGESLVGELQAYGGWWNHGSSGAVRN